MINKYEIHFYCLYVFYNSITSSHTTSHTTPVASSIRQPQPARFFSSVVAERLLLVAWLLLTYLNIIIPTSPVARCALHNIMLVYCWHDCLLACCWLAIMLA
jgi:hypothetical protein